MTDSTGEITLAKGYDPYGTVTQSAGNGQSMYAYTGEQMDISGLTYLRARYYNPTDGRFISRDTWSGDVNNPHSLNRWMYVQGNPVNYVDPSGNSSVSIRYGLNFTVVGDSTWSSENQKAVEEAVVLVAHKFVRTSGFDNWFAPSLFKLVYGIRSDRLMEFRWGGNDCYYCRPQTCQIADVWSNQDPNTCDCEFTDTCNCQPVGGYTHTAQLIEFASLWDNYSGAGGVSVQNLRKVNNVIHELGHAFSARLGHFPRQTVASYSTTINGEAWKMNSRIPDKYGFYENANVDGTRTWVQSGSVDDYGSEVFADMFLGWVRGTWANDVYGEERSKFMGMYMHQWIRQAMWLP